MYSVGPSIPGDSSVLFTPLDRSLSKETNRESVVESQVKAETNQNQKVVPPEEAVISQKPIIKEDPIKEEPKEKMDIIEVKTQSPVHEIKNPIRSPGKKPERKKGKFAKTDTAQTKNIMSYFTKQ